MFNMKRFLHLMLAVVMLLTCFQIPYAYAADDPVTVTNLPHGYWAEITLFLSQRILTKSTFIII